MTDALLSSGALQSERLPRCYVKKTSPYAAGASLFTKRCHFFAKKGATPLPFLVLTPLIDRTFAIGHCSLTCLVFCCFLVRAIRPNARVPPPHTFLFAEAGYPERHRGRSQHRISSVITFALHEYILIPNKKIA